MNTKKNIDSIVRNICKKYFSIEEHIDNTFCSIKDCSDFITLLAIDRDIVYVSPGFEFSRDKLNEYKFQSKESGNLKGYIRIFISSKDWEKTLEKHIKDLAYNYKIMLLKYKQKEINNMFK